MVQWRDFGRAQSILVTVVTAHCQRNCQSGTDSRCVVFTKILTARSADCFSQQRGHHYSGLYHSFCTSTLSLSHLCLFPGGKPQSVPRSNREKLPPVATMERNYREDQCNEIEALDSIYCGELEVLASEPLHKFKLPIATTEYGDQEVETEGLCCKLVFSYTDKYPDTAPLVEIEDTENFREGYEGGLLEHIQATIQENLGIEMIFSLVSSAQEWLNCKFDELKSEAENQKEEAKRLKDEEERKKFEGTRVTVESFMAWKTKFELDMGITERKEKILGETRKLTGRELFMEDNTLNESDLKFLMDAGEPIENVRIDESLFQNIEDLELGSEEDDEDDEDYVPDEK